MENLTDKLNDIHAGSVAIVGVPFDRYSSFMRGPADAPRHIREAFRSPSANTCCENGSDLEKEARLIDLGNLTIGDYIEDIRQPVCRILQQGAAVLALGGDHAVTFPIVKAYSETYRELNILHLDAHPDLYDQLDGNKYSHASPFARIMEGKLAKRMVQVGIRTMNPHQREQAEQFGVETIMAKDWQPGQRIRFNGPLYLSVDLDVLDPAFAPGLSHHEPGGLSTRDVLGIIQAIEAPLVGADLVELNPKRDINGVTAMVAAKIFKEIAAKMLAI